MTQTLIQNNSSFQQRDIIFISHATPEDNDFTIWLASRLQADGYHVWIDKQALLGGEKFWQEIDQTIRYKAIKFLLVYSENICVQKQRGILKDGIEKEKSLAESIAKNQAIKDFIILLNVDSSEYNLFIGADTLNQIPFYDNWASGYIQLLKKFEKDGLETTDKDISLFSRWYENEYVIKSGIKKIHEVYYDSWWPISKLPEYFYIYFFDSESSATLIQQQIEYPASKITNMLASFYETNEFIIEIEGKNEKINFEKKIKIKVDDVIKGTSIDFFPNTRDAENQLKSLLQRIFHLIMKKSGLCWHMMSNKKLAYFFPKNFTSRIMIKYKIRSRKRTKSKSIKGKYLDNFWHYALSAKPILKPYMAFSLKSHIVFTDNGYNPWEDTSKMHSARRKKGRLMFNEEWRDLLFAFLQALCKQDRSITIQISPSFELSMHPWTNLYHTNFGYEEPKEKDRHGILAAEIEYFDKEDEFEEQDKNEADNA